MNSSNYSYLYLHLNNLKTINSSKSFNFLRFLGIPKKANKKNNGESFYRENKATTFINIKAKAEPGQTKAREACALLAFSGLRKTIESTNYRVGAKVSSLFGLTTNNKNLREERIGLQKQNLWLCDTAQASGRLNALTGLKKYIKLAGFSGEKAGKNRLSVAQSLAVAKLQKKQRNNTLPISFTFLASSENPVGFYHGCPSEAAGLSQQKSENITAGFNQRILNQSFKQNLATHLVNCQKTTQGIHINKNLNETKGRQSNQLSLTTSAPLFELFTWGNQYDLPGATSVGLGTLAFAKPKVQENSVTTENQSFFSTVSKKLLNEENDSKKSKKENIYLRHNSFFTRFAQRGLLYKRKKNSLFTALGDFTKILQNLPTPKFSFLSKQNPKQITFLQESHLDSARKASSAATRAFAKKTRAKRPGYFASSHASQKQPLGFAKTTRTKMAEKISQGLLLALLLKKNAESSKSLPYNKVVALEADAGTLTKFYSASWFLEYIRTELSLRNANIKRVLSQAFILAQQPLPRKKKTYNNFSFSPMRQPRFCEQKHARTNSDKATATSKFGVAAVQQLPLQLVPKTSLLKSLFGRSFLGKFLAKKQESPLLQKQSRQQPNLTIARSSYKQGDKTANQTTGANLLLKKTSADLVLLPRGKKPKTNFPLKTSNHQLLPKFAEPQTRRTTAKAPTTTKFEYLGSTIRPAQLPLTRINYLPENATVIPHLIKGIKITFSGRTGGKKGMAKTLTKTVGRVPSSTLDEKVDFAKGTVINKVGSLGIKVWICYN